MNVKQDEFNRYDELNGIFNWRLFLSSRYNRRNMFLMNFNMVTSILSKERSYFQEKVSGS